MELRIKAAILCAIFVLVLCASASAQTIIEAAKEGDVKKVSELIKAGADFDMPDDNGIPPLMWAIMQGHEDTAVLLLENGAALKTKRNYDEVRIILGLVKDARRAAELLIKRGPYIQAGENYGSILIVNALRYGRKDVARILLESGIGLRLPDDGGVTPLAYAVVFGHRDIGERLYEGGAYFYELSMGEDATIRLAREKRHGEVVAFLVDRAAGAGTGERPSLAKAAEDGRLAVAEELLRGGADVNGRDASGDTPLYLAIEKKNIEMVKLLLGAGADPNAGCRGA